MGIVPTIIRDKELEARGFGGIYGVGQGALHPPALAVLSHYPRGATQNIAWVGKGIVYDTGGLSIKVIKISFVVILDLIFKTMYRQTSILTKNNFLMFN